MNISFSNNILLFKFYSLQGFPGVPGLRGDLGKKGKKVGLFQSFLEILQTR